MFCLRIYFGLFLNVHSYFCNLLIFLLEARRIKPHFLSGKFQQKQNRNLRKIVTSNEYSYNKHVHVFQHWKIFCRFVSIFIIAVSSGGLFCLHLHKVCLQVYRSCSVCVCSVNSTVERWTGLSQLTGRVFFFLIGISGSTLLSTPFKQRAVNPTLALPMSIWALLKSEEWPGHSPFPFSSSTSSNREGYYGHNRR